LTAAFVALAPAPPVSLLLRIGPLHHSSLIQPLMLPPAVHHYHPLPPPFTPPVPNLSPLSLPSSLSAVYPRAVPCWCDLCPDSEFLAGTG
jgi:hypothetical protein